MRHVKAAGLALVAVVALSAMAAPAQANNVTASKYPVVITGTDLGTKDGEFTRFTIGNGARFVECSASTLEGTLSNEEALVALTPNFSGCFANGDTKIDATWTWNGCYWGMGVGLPPSIQLTLSCPGGKYPELHIYENHTRHTENKKLCAYDLSAQGPLAAGSLEISNSGTATEDMVLNLSVAGVKTSSTSGSAILCGIASGGEGTSTLKGRDTITGETDNGTKEHVAVMVK